MVGVAIGNEAGLRVFRNTSWSIYLTKERER